MNAICLSGRHCAVCRDSVGGAGFRMRARVPHMACPRGLPMDGATADCGGGKKRLTDDLTEAVLLGYIAQLEDTLSRETAPCRRAHLRRKIDARRQQLRALTHEGGMRNYE